MMSQHTKEAIGFWIGAVIVIGLLYWIVCSLSDYHEEEEKAQFAYEQKIYDEGYREGYNDALDGDYDLEY